MKKHYSGQLRLRMPSSLHRELAERSQEEGVSLNTYLLYLISKSYGAQTERAPETARSAEGLLLVGTEDATYTSSSPLLEIAPDAPRQ